MPTSTEIQAAAPYGLDLDWERQDKEIGAISDQSQEVRELDDGFAFRYPGGDTWRRDLERVRGFLGRHYPYLAIEVTAEDAHHWLRITGPDDAKEVLQRGLDYASGDAVHDGSEVPTFKEKLLDLGPRMATAPLRMLPDFLVIGAAKAGTTSLYSYLSGHPAIGAAFRKELYFFDMHWHRGLRWYRARFPLRRDQRRYQRQHGGRFVTGEATPCYLFHPLAPQRVQQVVPQAKLIVSLRDPTERAYSHYCMNARRGIETLTFEQALDREEERLDGEAERMVQDPTYFSLRRHHGGYQARGRYAEQLERWLAVLPKQQLLILTDTDLKQDRAGTLARVQEFLGLEVRDLPDTGRRNFIPYPKIETRLRDRLRAEFAPHNARLEGLLGREFGWG